MIQNKTKTKAFAPQSYQRLSTHWQAMREPVVQKLGVFYIWQCGRSFAHKHVVILKPLTNTMWHQSKDWKSWPTGGILGNPTSFLVKHQNRGLSIPCHHNFIRREVRSFELYTSDGSEHFCNCQLPCKEFRMIGNWWKQNNFFHCKALDVSCSHASQSSANSNVPFPNGAW